MDELDLQEYGEVRLRLFMKPRNAKGLTICFLDTNCSTCITKTDHC